MSPEEFYRFLKNKSETECIETLIVKLRIRYKETDEWRYLKELLTVTYDGSGWEWEHDWYEGETFVEFLGYVEVSNVHVPYNLVPYSF